ncbi:MAG: adenylate/guanylate cyclase domain-containing protein [Hyphomicrobiales bacterium]|nr:adenylate/guanylate cyclase domain-containing protein [Hyphomicrobiales bacterium]
MSRRLVAVTATNRRKFFFVLVSAIIFASLGAATSLVAGRPIQIRTATAALIGTGLGLFEEFYVQSSRGNWLRNMHPLRALPIYVLAMVVLYIISLHLAHLLLWRLDDLPNVYRRLPSGVAFLIVFSLIGLFMLRVAHFVGFETLFHLTVGTYHRPVPEQKLLLFVDINGSTSLGEKLGALKMRALVRKFLSDLSRPIIDHGGDIYLHKGDGLIATWGLSEATRENVILSAVDAMFAAVARESGEYRRVFEVVPTFRVGMHGGEVIVSEQGDAKRSIGIYGDTINIAARMEEAARSHGVACVLSKSLADTLTDRGRLFDLGEEAVKGLSAPIPICSYQPRGQTEPVAPRKSPRPEARGP